MIPEPPRVAVIVAHPDDETLWAGGVLLLHPEWHPSIVSLCRGNDPDRAPRFARVLERYGATGAMGDLDDGPQQHPLVPEEVEKALLSLLPERRFSRLLTHGRCGEYTRHRRHEETCRAVVSLWASGAIRTDELWTFCYNDDHGRQLPRASEDSDVRVILPDDVWEAKREIVTSLYGFAPDSWEARTTPTVEGLSVFYSAQAAWDWVQSRGHDA